MATVSDCQTWGKDDKEAKILFDVTGQRMTIIILKYVFPICIFFFLPLWVLKIFSLILVFNSFV